MVLAQRNIVNSSESPREAEYIRTEDGWKVIFRWKRGIKKDRFDDRIRHYKQEEYTEVLRACKDWVEKGNRH